MRASNPLGVVFALFLAAGCGEAVPTAVIGETTDASSLSEAYTSSAGMTKTSMSGTLQLAGGGAPGDVLITPGGVCHFFQMPVVIHLDGDVQGPVTIVEQLHDIKCDATVLLVSGSLAGQVTWNGLTGDISGRIMLTCSRNGGPPPPTCVTRVMNATGSGELEGVLFHFDLQPGWFPFDYAGTVFSK